MRPLVTKGGHVSLSDVKKTSDGISTTFLHTKVLHVMNLEYKNGEASLGPELVEMAE